MARILNTWTLGGLMVGPILGSGIVLLPPLAYGRLGSQAIWAWLVILVLGGAFAGVFIRMALRVKTDAGIAGLIAREWGEPWGRLASNSLTGAVCFGAAPVFLTGAGLWPQAWMGGWPIEAVAGVFLVLTTILLLAGLKTVSRLALILSTTTAGLLVLGGCLGLAESPVWVWPAPSWAEPTWGSTLLILFWAIVGWEVVGNYSSQVTDPEKTIPRAGLISLAAVSLVYLITTLSLQTLNTAGSPTPSVATILTPLLGPAAGWAAGILGGGLCLVTVLMFVGAVTRMTADRARTGEVPGWLAARVPGGTPRTAILLQASLSGLLLFLVWLDWAALEDLVSIANLFFLGNALLGLAAAWKLLPGWPTKLSIGILAAALILLMAQGQLIGWMVVAAVVAATWVQTFFRVPPAAS